MTLHERRLARPHKSDSAAEFAAQDGHPHERFVGLLFLAVVALALGSLIFWDSTVMVSEA